MKVLTPRAAARLRARAALFLIALGVLSNTSLGCGGDDGAGPDGNSWTGTYTLLSIEGAALPSHGITSGSIQLKPDGTYTLSWTPSGVGDNMSGTWSYELKDTPQVAYFYHDEDLPGSKANLAATGRLSGRTLTVTAGRRCCPFEDDGYVYQRR